MKRRSFIQKTAVASMALSFMPMACKHTVLDTETLILGGGLSGLYLAYLLDKAGKDYILLEGSNRLGGRMFTRQDINRDVGGRGIGNLYVQVMKLIKEFEIEMIDITDYMLQPAAIYVDGKLYPQWSESTTNPSKLQFRALGKVKQLTELDEWYKRQDLDEAYSELLKRNGLTEQELDLANISANYNDIRETSSINAYHSMAFQKFNGSKRILNFKGGTKTFIDAIASRLSKPVLKNKMVNVIDDTTNKVIVSCTDGSRYKAKKVVSTLPFTTLRDVKMNTTFTANQEKAIKELQYTFITQIHLNHTEAFWEHDKTPLSMWTDTPIERVMNMSSDPVEKKIACWVNGKGTTFFDTMSEAQIAKYTIDKINKIRPSSIGKIEYLGTQNWGKYPFNKGAYAEFGIGQASWFKDMIRPAGNIHFAGEHVARKSRGIEGAAESALRVFNELMNKK